MSQEERKDFVNEQMDALQHELEKASVHQSTHSITAGLHMPRRPDTCHVGGWTLTPVLCMLRQRRGSQMQRMPPCRNRSKVASSKRAASPARMCKRCKRCHPQLVSALQFDEGWCGRPKDMLLMVTPTCASGPRASSVREIRLNCSLPLGAVAMLPGGGCCSCTWRLPPHACLCILTPAGERLRSSTKYASGAICNPATTLLWEVWPGDAMYIRRQVLPRNIHALDDSYHSCQHDQESKRVAQR